MKWFSSLIGVLWRTFWRLVWFAFFLLLCAVALLFYFQKEAAPHILQTMFFQAQQVINGQQALDMEASLETLEQLSTDTVDMSAEGRWPTNAATVYIETQDPTFRSAYETAIANWNATGAFTFTLVDDASQADIIATEMNDGQTQAAGEASSSTNTLTNYLVAVTVKLNRFYLLNPTYGYSMERIIHTAEHELGHAIGLGHEDNHTSVMESAGSHNGIQQTDIDAVTALYATQ